MNDSNYGVAGCYMDKKREKKRAKALSKFAYDNRLNPTLAEEKMKSVLNKNTTGERWTFERPWRWNFVSCRCFGNPNH